MNTEKFTQGEWRAEITRVYLSDGRMMWIEGKNFETQEANASLIAAAPEMYRMLESVHRLLNGYLLYMPIRTDIKHQQIEFNAKQIEELLKKARGENE